MSKRKRSSCASGSGYVASRSIGFCGARTKNGSGSGIVWPLAVTLCSCIASSSAACVRGGARLISSAKTMLANTGPCTKRKLRAPLAASSSRISVPVMSLGTRSGVNWIRWKSRCTASASERTMSVFARPGTPTSSACPPAMSDIRISSSTVPWPTMRRCTSARRRPAAATSASRSCSGRGVTVRGADVTSPPSLERLANRTTAAVRHQQDRSVHDARLGERRVLVEHFPAAQLEHELLLELDLGAQRLDRAQLDLDHRLRRRGDDANYIPDLWHFHADRDRGGAFRRDVDRRTARAKAGNEWRRHCPAPPAGVRVAKERDICMSHRELDPVIRVPLPSGLAEVAMTISSPPCPRKEQKPGPSLSMNAE